MCAHAPNAANSAVIRSGIIVLMQHVASTVADAAYPRKSIHVIADLLLVLEHRTPHVIICFAHQAHSPTSCLDTAGLFAAVGGADFGHGHVPILNQGS